MISSNNQDLQEYMRRVMSEDCDLAAELPSGSMHTVTSISSVSTAVAAQSLTEAILQLEDKVDNLDKLCRQTKGFIASCLEAQNTMGAVLAMKQYRTLNAKRTRKLQTIRALRMFACKAEDGQDEWDYQEVMDSIVRHQESKMTTKGQEPSMQELLQEACALVYGRHCVPSSRKNAVGSQQRRTVASRKA